MLTVEENLLVHKTIFLNLSLKERAIGLDQIIKDLSSFFDLHVFFWNLTKKKAIELNLQAINEQLIDSQFSQTLTEATAYHNKAVGVEEIIDALVDIYENSDSGIFIIENLNQVLVSESLDIFQFEQLKTWLIKLAQKSRLSDKFYIVLLGSSHEITWEYGGIAPEINLPYLSNQEVVSLLKEKFSELNLDDEDRDNLIAKSGNLLAGMTLPHLLWGVDNITNSLPDDSSVSQYLAGLLAYKQEKLKLLGLSFLPPPEISEVGGMDLLKQHIANLEIEFAADRKRFKIDKPPAWALVGVPGVGKSHTAKILQMKLALPMIFLPADKIKSNGSAYLAKILELCEVNAPNIVYIDELDKLFTDADLTGDTATTLSVFLTWLQEKQGDCFVLATLNRLDVLPPELLRAGRFSEIFYVGFPQPGERREIFSLYLKKYDSRYEEINFTLEQWRELIDESIKFTGSEIAQVVYKAYRHKFFSQMRLKQKLQTKFYSVQQDLNKFLKTLYNKQPLSTVEINIDTLDYQISEILRDIPFYKEEIDTFYGHLLDLLEDNDPEDSNINSAKTILEMAVSVGYKHKVINDFEGLIKLDDIDPSVSQALLDFPKYGEQIDKVYDVLYRLRKQIDFLDRQPIEIDFPTLLKFTEAEVPLFERAVEKVMAIENLAREFCTPVSSPDESELIDREPTFWLDMKNEEAVNLINQVRREQAEQANQQYQDKEGSLEEVIDISSEEYATKYSWVF